LHGCIGSVTVCFTGVHIADERHNMNEIIVGGGVNIKCWTDGVQLEDSARQQLINVARLPIVGPYVAAMPDVHWGNGATVGSVIPQRAAIIPAAVGVDGGCGVMALRTTLIDSDLDGKLPAIREAIERAIPVGGPGVKGSWQEQGRTIPNSVVSAWRNDFDEGYDAIIAKHPLVKGRQTMTQLGTLGTGNHFIEVCRADDGQVWFMLHSGSRGVGNRIGQYFINLAKEQALKLHRSVDADAELAWLDEGSVEFRDYIEALGWVQAFASRNRSLMMGRVIGAVDKVFGKSILISERAINCHHNYVEQYGDVWLTRKGAVSAREGELGIIPGSMGAKSFIVRGKGNKESFESCSHGAGRVMSRGQARKTFTLEQHAEATAGVECRKDKDVLDETPGAYKDIDAVMAAQTDLVEIVTTLKQVVCIKG